MKKLYVLFSLLLLSNFPLHGVIRKMTMRVDGMTCSLCAQGLKSKLKKLTFLKKIEKINVKDGIVTITLKKKNELTRDELSKQMRTLVQKAGFTFVDITEIEEK
ncbi:MAG: cation transporter [Epsilonproteobacteria bacterium]|nr:cation transporter [Campylobacterota bacterium]